MASTITGGIRRTLLYLYGSLILVASVAAGLVIFRVTAQASLDGRSPRKSILAGGLRSFEIVPLETVSETSSNASIGDLNGDGHADIVLVKGRHWQVTSKIFFGDGQGHFAPGPALPSKAAKSYSASLADMTRSGHLDMVLSNDQPDRKLVLLNDGKGNFTVGGTYGDPHWSTRNAAVGDLNGDGYPDIVVANREMTSYVCLNDGKLHFDCRPLQDSPSAATVAIADMNGDGLNDVIYACRDSCQSVVYFNDGKGNFARRLPWGPPKSSTRAAAVADFDGDGHLDIAACPEQMGCFVYLNDGKGNFGAGIQFQQPAALPYSMIAVDLNRDGRADILVGYVEAPLMAYFNDGTGKKFQAVPFGDGKGTIYGMAAGDLDGDGWPDIVVARSDAPCFVMFNRPPKK
jgi:VCBS repeat protein